MFERAVSTTCSSSRSRCAGWRAHANNPRVLWLTYEDMKRAPESCAREVAAFCELEVTEERLRDACARSSIEAMRDSAEKFDHVGELLAERNIRTGAFIGKGAVGAGAGPLTGEQARAFDEARAGPFPDLEWRLADFLQ